MTRWIVTLAIVGGVAVLALTSSTWLPRVLMTASANTDAIQGLTGAIQLLLWASALVIFVVRVWSPRSVAPAAPAVQEKVPVNRPAARPSSAPQFPPLVVGREDALQELKRRIRNAAITVLTGWPGIGKTTMIAALAHDRDVHRDFPDGVLWAAIGKEGDVLTALRSWGADLGAPHIAPSGRLDEAVAQLSGLLRDRTALLLIDDVWSVAQVQPFRIGGRNCRMVVTTRLTGVAQHIAPTGDDLYQLPLLSEDAAVELLTRIAPVAASVPAAAHGLVRELECLPLAIRVAGHLLRAEEAAGFGVDALLADLRKGKGLLESAAPPATGDVEGTVSVAALLHKSTDLLDPETRDRFATLGVVVPKPATFDAETAAELWDVEDPKPTLRTLIDRGLIERVSEAPRFQMHALLVLHARSLLAQA